MKIASIERMKMRNERGITTALMMIVVFPSMLAVYLGRMFDRNWRGAMWSHLS
jgi:hypothetical protein